MKNILVFIALVIVSIGAGLYMSPEFQNRDLPKEKSTGEALVGGSFKLTDHYGTIRTDKEFRGNFMLIFFGFTNCPTICPPGIMNMTEAMELLGSDGKKVIPIFITVDPERDTPERMKEFLGNFYSTFIGLTGNKEDIKEVETAYKVYSSKVEAKDEPDGYIMDHSGFIYLMDESGKYVTHFSYNAEPKEMANKIRGYIQ